MNQRMLDSEEWPSAFANIRQRNIPKLQNKTVQNIGPHICCVVVSGAHEQRHIFIHLA
jgi:hypothetical protein